MLPIEYEKLVNGACLSNPDSRDNIPQRVVFDLDPSRFGDPTQQKIFIAIKSCVDKKTPPNTINVSIELKSDDYGGIEFLESLAKFPYIFGTKDLSGIETWVRMVDWNGRARLVYRVLTEKINKPLEDFQNDISKSDDPDDALNSIISKVSSYLAGTKSGYSHISEIGLQSIAYIKKSFAGEGPDKLPCGWPNLEKYSIPSPRTFGVITGIASMGKTQFALQMGLGAALKLKANNQSGTIFINTFEQIGWRLVNRLACLWCGINSNAIARGEITKEQTDKLVETITYFSTLPLEFNDDPNLTSSQLITQAIAASLKTQRVLGITDYVELLKDKGESEELRVSTAARNVRTIAWETGSCEVLVSQLNNAVIHSSSKIGGMFAARYSGAIAQAADWFIEIWNPIQMKRSQISFVVPEGKCEDFAYALIEKNKNGPLGEEPFEWIPEFTRFRDMSLPIGKIYSEDKIEEESEF